MEKIRICLSDLPKEKMTKGTNGKIYISLVVDKRKELDKWGQDLKVFIDPTKDERAAGATKIYVGSGKTITFECSKDNTVTDGDLQKMNIKGQEKSDDFLF